MSNLHLLAIIRKSEVLKFASNIPQDSTQIQTGFMKKAIFALAAIAVLSFNCSIAPEASAKDKASWGNFVAGKTTAERWTNVAKIAPNLLGMTRAEVEKELGKGTYSEKQDELMYLITDDGSKYKVFDNIVISFGKDGKVKCFVIITKAND